MLTVENINLIQRLIAILALVLLSIQIYTNTNKKLFTYFMYLFIFVEPILVILARYIFNSDLDPFYMYTDLCVLCDGRGEFIINFLRIAFFSVSIAVFAPLFGYLDKTVKRYEKYLYYFYFVGFYSLSLYLFNSGPIIKPLWFVALFWVCQIVVLMKVFKEIKEIFKPKSKI